MEMEVAVHSVRKRAKTGRFKISFLEVCADWAEQINLDLVEFTTISHRMDSYKWNI
jgi:hypothetical protein